MKLNEVNWDLINKKRELMKNVKTRSETPEQRQRRREHAKKAIQNNYDKGFINKETYDRQMKQQMEESYGRRDTEREYLEQDIDDLRREIRDAKVTGEDKDVVAQLELELEELLDKLHSHRMMRGE